MTKLGGADFNPKWWIEPPWWKARTDSFYCPLDLDTCAMAYAHAVIAARTYSQLNKHNKNLLNTNK